MSFSIDFGNCGVIRDKWTRIGGNSNNKQNVHSNLIDITMSNTSFTTAEDLIMGAALRGGVSLRASGEKDVLEVPQEAMMQLHDMLVTCHRWYLMFGMVAFLSDPTHPPFFCVIPDPRTGYFVAKHTKAMGVEVGWRSLTEDGIGYDFNEARPDPNSHVLYFAGHAPDITNSQPFRSRLSILLQLHDMMQETRRNLMDAEYMATHPPVFTSIRQTGAATPQINAGAVTRDLTVGALDAARNGRTMGNQFRIAAVHAEAQAEVEYNRMLGLVVPSPAGRNGFDARGNSVMVNRAHAWNNHIPLRPGTDIHTMQMPALLSDWMDRERYFTEVLFSSFGLPIVRIASSRYRNTHKVGGSGATTAGSADTDRQMREAVMNAREKMQTAFRFMYEKFVLPANQKRIRSDSKKRAKIVEADINTLEQYIAYLTVTEQLEREPMYAAKMKLAEQKEKMDADLELQARVATITKQAHDAGTYVDQVVVYQVLKDLRDKIDENYKDTERDLHRTTTVTLEFLQPPNLDADTLLSLAREGMFNQEEASRLFSSFIGLSDAGIARASKKNMFMAAETHEKLKMEAEKMKQDYELAWEKLKLEREKIKSQERLAEKKAAETASAPPAKKSKTK